MSWSSSSEQGIAETHGSATKKWLESSRISSAPAAGPMLEWGLWFNLHLRFLHNAPANQLSGTEELNFLSKIFYWGGPNGGFFSFSLKSGVQTLKKEEVSSLNQFPDGEGSLLLIIFIWLFSEAGVRLTAVWFNLELSWVVLISWFSQKSQTAS